MAIDNQFSSPEEVGNSSSESFKTPDEVAAHDNQSTASPLVPATELNEDIVNKKNRRSKKRFKLSWPPTKKQLIVLLVVIICLVVGGYFGYRHFKSKNDKPVVVTKSVANTPLVKSTAVPSDLTGLPVNPDVNKLPVTAVMIENSLDARPQSGLSQAGVVFEAVAEGGVTRFMALYQDTAPTSIGPIRSARPYYIQWELGFDAGYAHVGGSPDALADISAWNVRDLDQFYNGNYYQRITTREAPHNVYSGIPTLNQLEYSKGYNSSQYTSWTRKAADPAKVPAVTTITMNLSGPDYNPTYTYDTKTNSYNRDEAGAPQIDANTNTQISPKVVIGIVVPETQGALDSSGAYYSDYNVLGTGTAYVFQDGNLTIGQWTKSSNTSQILFTKDDGSPLALDPGQTWITAITSSSNISYSK